MSRVHVLESRAGTLMNSRASTFLIVGSLTLATLALGACGWLQPRVEPGQVQFQDDFSRPGSGWDRTREQSYWADYLNGAYQIQIETPNTEVWALPRLDLEDAQISVETVKVAGPDDNVFTFKELAAKLGSTGGPITGRGVSNHNEPGGAFAAHLVDVEVDPETGKVDILRFTAVQDVGTAIHPSYVEGQIQGGVVQGIGWALNEEYVYSDDGVMQNPGFLDYRMPTCYDVPMIDTVLVEVPNPGHPYGVRGVGEANIIPPTAAIGNAIHNAMGIRLEEMPMNPPTIVKALQKKG